jgi:hypothetical protein
VLKSLPYSTCLLETVTPLHDVQVTASFSLGSAHWDVASYTVDPKLKPFRDYVRIHADAREGRAAALAVAHSLRQDIPFGKPQREFFQYTYDPKVDFAAHLRGEPGHCVTLSGFLAASLLSVGIPARVVQLVPREKTAGGHNLVEVWDHQAGWCLIDPSFDGYPVIDNRPCSGLEALLYPEKIRWMPKKSATGEAGDPKEFYETKSFPLRDGHLIYPEPWLYLRTGPKASSWPIRGRFILVGEPSWQYGPGQTVLRYGVVVCGTLGIACLVLIIFDHLSKKVTIGGQKTLPNEDPNLEQSTSAPGG